ncbi:amidohydrolase [Nocardioides sp. LML1-1-1.1]|uniref:amidohydrolase n=1 Tax=Nocardioides sp. LML1-1-1.1 TaxID=3135248 RepID=UPI00344A5526
MADIKARVCAAVDARAEELVRISRAIHARPEIGHEEFFAHGLLTDALEREGLKPERGAFGLATAFAARAGTDGPTVAVLCEYDALQDIGHACGHNVIAAAGLGAGLAAATVAPEMRGRLLVLGTPCEEMAPQGKITLAERGALAGVDAAVMVHPADADMVEMDTLASIGVIVTYKGVAAHAAAAPHHGRNALDAAILGYNAVAALRQHIAPDERVLGVLTEVPQKVNVIPDRVVSRWSLRSTTLARAQQLEPRVMACLESGALAAGCEMEVTHLGVTEEVRTNRALTASYVANMEALGRQVGAPVGSSGTVGSTDMGHVSYLVPAIHPLIAVAPPGVKIHEAEFAAAAASAAADRAVIDGAKALAMTIVDYWTDPTLRARAKAEFEADRA